MVQILILLIISILLFKQFELGHTLIHNVQVNAFNGALGNELGQVTIRNINLICMHSS